MDQPEKQYKVEYLGGHKAHPMETKTYVFIYPDSIEIGALGIWIPYKSILNIENTEEKKVSASRAVMMGAGALLWKKKHVYTVIEYHDGYENQKVIIDFDKDVETAQPLIYNRMVEAKKETSTQVKSSPL
jgi:hypothetical protein